MTIAYVKITQGSMPVTYFLNGRIEMINHQLYNNAFIPISSILQSKEQVYKELEHLKFRYQVTKIVFEDRNEQFEYDLWVNLA